VLSVGGASSRPTAAVSSFDPDSGCFEAAFSSSSSVISFSLRRRRELDEEVRDPEAVCSAQAEDNAFSVKSSGEVRGKIVS
jgi:hypothetical protein